MLSTYIIDKTLGYMSCVTVVKFR